MSSLDDLVRRARQLHAEGHSQSQISDELNLSMETVTYLLMKDREGAVPKDNVPAFREALREGGKVPVFLSAGDIHIFVAGGSPGYSLYFHYDFPAHQTRKVWGATLTKAGHEVGQSNSKE